MMRLYGTRRRRTSFSIPSSSLFPLSVSANGRYLQTAGGEPFALVGESAWFIAALNPTDMEAHLDNLVSMGFTAMMMMGPPFWDGSPQPNYNNDHAFSTPNNFNSSFNAPYWSYIDTILTAAAARRLLVKYSPLYYGYNGEASSGWWPTVASKTTTQIQSYGAAVATRLAAHKNIIWDLLGDYMPSDSARMSALVAGIRSVSSLPCTGEPARGHNTHEIQPTGGNWDLNFCYCPQAAYTVALDGYNANVGPMLAGELYYEHRTNPTITTRQFRAQFWFLLTSGAPMLFAGNEKIWDFDEGWAGDDNGETYLQGYDDAGRAHMAVYAAFIKTIAWWDLVPDQSSTLVTAGRGTYSSESYVTAARTSDSTLAVIYVPNGGSITVNLAVMAGSNSVTARWLDPTTGTFYAATGSPFAQNSRSFNASSERGNNAAGNPDWVLVLTVVP